MAKVIDIDPLETREWLDSLHAVLRCDGTERALFLEPVSKSPEEDYQASELDEAEEVLWVILPSDEDATLPLNPMRRSVRPPTALRIASAGVHPV